MNAWRLRRLFIRCFLLMAVVATAVGCATRKHSTGPLVSPEERDEALLALQDFHVQGGLGVWTDEESFSGRIDWLQQSGDLDITLTAPLGFASLRLRRVDGQASLQRGKAAPLLGSSAGSLLQAALGLNLPLPLDQLSYWLRGLPGQATDVHYADSGWLQSLKYRDAEGTRWRVRVLRYTTLETLQLPALITAKGGPYNVRLALANWQKDAVPASENGDDKSPGPERLAIPGR